MIKPRMVSLGARIPGDLKDKVSDYCDRKGIKMQFFVTEALREKLTDVEQYQMKAENITVSSAGKAGIEKNFRSALSKVNQRHAKTLKKLAE